MISDIINSNKNSIIRNLGFYNYNSKIKNSIIYTVSCPINSGIAEAFNIDIEAEIFNVMSNKINTEVFKSVFKKLEDTNKVDYINIEGLNKPFDNICASITRHDYLNAVCSGAMGAKLEESIRFEYELFGTNNTISGSTPYKVGKIGKTSIWVDPVMKWNDDRIFLFDYVEMNPQIIDWQDINGIVSIRYANESFVDSTMLCVIENMDSPSYEKYKSIQRDIKIEKIIK